MATKFYAREGVVFKGKSDNPPKSGFDLERLLKFQLSVLNVPFNDDCCTDSTHLPLALNSETNELVSYDPATDTWVIADIIDSIRAIVKEQIEEVGLQGNGDMIATFIPPAEQDDIAAGVGGAISVANYLTTINTDAGGDAFTLADGDQIGQLKKILLVVDGGGNAVITVDNGPTITMGDAGDYVVLIWEDSLDWIVIENSGCSLS